MRREPQARGRCHDADYWELTQILSADVDRAHAVAVEDEAAALVRAAKDAALHLGADASALRAGAGGVRLLLQEHFHAQALGLVGELLAHAAMRPLVDLLVVRMSNIRRLSEISHIANDQRSHACLLQRGDELARLLVLDLFDLLLDLLELLFLRADHPLAPLAAFLHASIDAAI